MATFFQGEQLAQVVSITGTNTDLDVGEYPVIYTVPTGYYAFLKFAYMGTNNAFYYTSAVNAEIRLTTAGITPTGGASDTIKIANGVFAYSQQKLGYRNGFTFDLNDYSTDNALGLYDFFLEEGDKFFLRALNNNQNVKYEVKLFLYKKP